MKKVILFQAFVVAFVFSIKLQSFSQELSWENIGRENRDLKVALVKPGNARIIYIGAGNGIFKTEDGGLNWRNILSVRGQNKGVSFLLSDSQDENLLYAATGSGLFFSPNAGARWNRIFQGKNSLENECTGLAVLPYAIFLGTKSGLFVSKDKGRSWHKETGKIGNSQVLNIAHNPKEPQYLYIAAQEGVFVSKDCGGSWERVFVRHPVENGNDVEEDVDDRDEALRFSDIRYIAIDPNNLNYLYLATGKGVYISKDKGKTWDLFPSYGLLSQDIRFILISDKSKVFAISKSGIFEHGNERWNELSFGLAVDEVSFLALDTQNNIYAACDKGLFKASASQITSEAKENEMAVYYKDEPKISELQDAAIKYAEVGQEKILEWRSKAAKKALLPQVSLGIDRNTSDLWHWESGSSTKSGDDNLMKGRDSIDWDIALSWDLSELIWNDAQTSIDVRSRLTVQLRMDVLDEVTKIYFERLRVKMELDNLSIEDRKKRFEKELKLEELTASLDALTGGYFSRQLHNPKPTI
jgi:hypothetical protein